MGRAGVVCENVPALRRVFQLLLMGESGMKVAGKKAGERSSMVLCTRPSVSDVARNGGSGMYPLGLGPWGSGGPGGSVWRRRDGKGRLHVESLLGVSAGESRSRQEVHRA